MKKSVFCLFILLFLLFSRNTCFAGFRIHAGRPAIEFVSTTPGPKVAEAGDEYALSGHHGHHGGHHSHGGHSHHSYRVHGNHHHFAEHYHHYHSHFHVYHQTDFAVLSIIFDIFVVTCVLGVIFGALGMRLSPRKRLARTGFFIGLIEIAAIVVLLAVIH